VKPSRYITKSNYFKPIGPMKLNQAARFNLQVRYYARQSTRRGTTTEEQKRTDQEQTSLWGNDNKRQQEEQQNNQYNREPEQEDEGSTETALTPGCRKHLAKVYGTMMGAMGLSSIGVVTAGLLPIISLPALILSFIASIGIIMTDKSRVTLRQNMLMGFGFLMGAGIAPLVLSSSPGVVFAALLGTSTIFGGFSLAALRAKRKSMLYMGGLLMGGIFFLLATSLAGIFLPMLGVTNPAFLGALYNINVYGGLGIFSLFVAYDTQNMIEQYHAGNNDHITPALNMFINLIQIFIRLLEIFRR